jgi:membrane associated rhomboid family serine protease
MSDDSSAENGFESTSHLAVVRSTENAQRLRDWQLALLASDIEAAVAQRGGMHLLCVSADDAARAVRVLAAYDAENPPRPREQEPALEQRPADAAFVAVALLLLFHMFTGGRDAPSVWFASGAAAARRIQAGEWWRCVTALTLHADALHALGNAASGGIFLVALGRALGGGRAVLLTLVTGALATYLNTFWRNSDYRGVGASTAIFATLGLLAALQIVRRSAVDRHAWRAWAPFAAALGILAMIGASPTADVVAHMLGLLTGLSTGLLLPALLRPSPTRAADRAFGLFALLVVVVAWLLARSHS